LTPEQINNMIEEAKYAILDFKHQTADMKTLDYAVDCLETVLKHRKRIP